MSLPTGLSQRNGVWQLRIGVPADLTHLYEGVDAYRGSLKTRDRTDAITKAHALIAQYRATFDQQRSNEAVRRAPPFVALTPELETYLAANAGWLALLVDDVVRFTPGMAAAVTPGVRYLTAGDPAPLLLDDNPERWNKVQEAALSYAKSDLAAGRLERVQQAADATLLGLGIRIDWALPQARLALARIARAQVRAFQITVERSRGEPHDTPARPVAPVSPAPAESSDASKPKTAALHLRDLKADWLAIKARSTAAVKITDRALRLIAEAGIDVAVSDLTRTHGATYRAYLVKTGIRGQSVKNLVAPIQALLNVAVDAGKLPANPWAGLRIDTSDSIQRLPWRLEDLKKLAIANNERTDASRWLFPLLLHTGARLGEIAQLELADIREIDGVPAVEIHDRATEGHEKRSVKTKAGLRVVPVHQSLIDLGFLAYVEEHKEAGERFLFPRFIQNGKRLPSDLAGQDFMKLREDAKVERDERFTAHSLRHNVRSALAAAGVNDQIIDKLVGHESGTVQGRYTHAATQALAEAVAKLNWRGLGLRRSFATQIAPI
ncbi:site-specific integrase [Variovorax sp. PBL-E5]|uniref:site-specific integrase n=1 Tax=Variovorax sp. PBL-E5 TaxID=434014 RepID=UPI001316BDC5|nr:site-specific integrase [Variovorax sp. PBL-E5]VTU29917.1 site-specific tyrosine recombinase XerC [Variovorax sp. PBL-E5]